MPEYLDQGRTDTKSILQSKTFWANVIPIVATLIGSQWPAVGDFVQAHGLELVGFLAAGNIGLRAATKEPVTLSVSKRF
jgi:hypothetical protein